MIGFTCIVMLVIWNTCEAASCGTLYPSPRKNIFQEKDYVDLVYVPTSAAANQGRQWWRKNPDAVSTLLSPSRGTRYTVDSGSSGNRYVLRISHLSLGDIGIYYIRCTASDSSQTVLLNVIPTGTTTCGYLQIVTNNQTSGSVFQLLFQPAFEQTFFWQHEVSGTFTTIDKHDPKFEETRNDDRSRFVLKISSKTSDAGRYRVTCDNNVVSNAVELTVVVSPPSQPTFSNLQTFSNCENCLPAIIGQYQTITCNSYYGSRPLEMNIYQNNIKLDSFTLFGQHNVGTVSFTPTVDDENTTFRCTVKNKALDVPLVTSVKLYLFRKPNKPVIQSSPALREGSLASIRCMSSGGRPAPTMSFVYNNTFVDFPNTPAFSASDNTFRVDSTFVMNVSRYDNGGKLICTSKHAEITRLDSDDRLMDVFFPPLTVDIVEIGKVSNYSGDIKMTLQCIVGQSNPNSTIEWRGLKKVQRKQSELSFKKGDLKGWTLTQAMTLSLTHKDNRRDIICAVSNAEYPQLDLTAVYRVNITYMPIISITPGPQFTAYEGDDITVPCSVDSNPTSVITWYNTSGNIHSKEQGKSNTLSLNIRRVSNADAGVYTCSAQNGIGLEKNMTVQLLVKSQSEKPSADTYTTDTGGSSAGTVAALTCTITLIAIVMVIVAIYIVKKRRDSKRSNNNGSVRVHVEARQPSVNPPADDPVYNNIATMNKDTEHNTPVEYACVIPKSQRQSGPLLNESKQLRKAQAVDKTGPNEYVSVPSKPRRQSKQNQPDEVKKGASSAILPEPVEYSSVIRKPQGQPTQKQPEQETQTAPGRENDTTEMVYAELHLGGTGPDKRSLVKQVSQTEYVSIDFTKQGVVFTE